MSKYCMECGNELSNEAKFCTNCGKQQKEINQRDRTIEQIDNESTEEIQVSTGPAALDLKTAYSILKDASNIIDKVQILEKPIARDIENKLFKIFALIDKAQNVNPEVVIKDPSTNNIITCDIVRAGLCT